MIDQDLIAELRKAIAIEHNVLLCKDDAILMLVTLHDAVLQRHVDTLTDRNKVFLEAIKTAQQQGIADAKIAASKMILEGGSYLQTQAREGLTEALKDAIEQHKTALGKAWREIELARKTVIAAAVVSCSCALVTIITVIKYAA